MRRRIERAKGGVGGAGGPVRGAREEPIMSDTTRRAVSRRKLLAGAAAGTALLAVASLVRAQAQVLKIAVLLPRSGSLAPARPGCHRGALLAPKLPADYGYKVELVHVDSESNPDVARTPTERVI